MKRLFTLLSLSLIALGLCQTIAQEIITITAAQKYLVVGENGFNPPPGSVLEVEADRTDYLKILGLQGTAEEPITIINTGGQVHITNTTWGAIELKDCQHVIITGTGDANYRYGFLLEGKSAGVGLTEYSSDITVEFVEIAGVYSETSQETFPYTFFGIVAKKDFGGTLPDGATEFPVFDNLVIHDNYIHGVHEGMYIGETTSPGMELRNMRIHNNIVVDTYKEAIQIANTVTGFEVYNNLMLRAGIEGRYGHKNLLQIGDNSQGAVFNNILIDCPAYGLICLGTGKIDVYNNYFEQNRGIFSDDRNIIFPEAEMRIYGNYFKDIQTGDNDFQVIKYYNNQMDLYVHDNFYNVPDSELAYGFLNVQNTVETYVFEDNNQYVPIDPILYTLQDGMYTRDPELHSAYQEMGPLYLADPTPEIQRIKLKKRMVQLIYGKTFDWSGLVLVDEQDLDPLQNERPRSKYWKPKNQRNKSDGKGDDDDDDDDDKDSKKKNTELRHVIIHLDYPCFIDEIFLFDQKKAGKVTFSYLSNDEWITGFKDRLAKTNKWKQHQLQIETQAIRFTVDKSFKGRMNEIAIYGYSIGTKKSGENNLDRMPIQLPQLRKAESFVKVYPNPATEWIDIQASFEDISTDLLDINGRIVHTTQSKHIAVSDFPNGMYFVRTINRQTGKTQTNRLIINH